ncbi:hypothetical protein BN8_00096 [Fibrisoma limi BUZ 3]|uniref:Uncharacterized protein n=1 Tax=Fibrisoma limi BUZ 3 TaxID=1185876 RepID=I2GBA7_9BACT|nr:hypothetical protein [Fibrisoma limi]CCH51181.1 hypothetical protein BN8_00096 [Fibrisoma limi BUZ 3]
MVLSEIRGTYTGKSLWGAFVVQGQEAACIMLEGDRCFDSHCLHYIGKWQTEIYSILRKLAYVKVIRA